MHQHSEKGSATIVVLAMISAALMLAGALFAAAQMVLASQSLQGAVDRAALAASDVSRGVSGEFPCDVARQIVAAPGFRLVSCEISEGRARVIGEATVSGLTMSRRSHAGVSHSGQP